ncbi:CHASE3 domain-containing protein [Acidithrix ferrooxidans]|uniref:Methyl-accepting protein IV n=1 Tax=Acidithrix ferrooxidans TaxID=1280514 RepID=A0A0D8HEE7_9ACTN|nr:CHASE3 domain-containing protein [Acidithrix ferrooxidans]KJF16177.1 methyl-accepting protein IV [Acidithrix ferrooxidans]
MITKVRIKRSRLSFSAIFLLAGLLLSVAALVNASAIFAAVSNEANVANSSLKFFHPAENAEAQLLIGYLNQETGLRGYVLTGDTSFLAPFVSGTKQVTAAYKILDSALGPYGLLDKQLHAVQLAGTSWEISATLHEIVPSLEESGLKSAIQASLQSDQATFDALRNRIATLNSSTITTEDTLRNAATVALDDLRTTVAVAAIVSLVIILTLGTMFWLMIITPMRKLQSEADTVANGNLSTPVSLHGVREIESLSNSIESMRQGILKELDIQRKTALLDAQFRERREVAEAIHDNPLQLLAAAKLRLQMGGYGVEQLSSDPVVSLIDRATEWMRNMIATLYPPGLARSDFEQAVKEHISSLELGTESRINAVVELSELKNRDSHSEPTLLLGFRCVQEFASNALKGSRGGPIDLSVVASKSEMTIHSVNQVSEPDIANLKSMAQHLIGNGPRRHSQAGHLGIPLLVDSIESIGGQLSMQLIFKTEKDLRKETLFERQIQWNIATKHPIEEDRDNAPEMTLVEIIESMGDLKGTFISFRATIPLLGDGTLTNVAPVLSN